MGRLFIVSLLVLLPIIIYSQEQESEKVNVPVLDYNAFEPYLNQKNDTLYIINFWATWCAPCIKELPYFQRIHDEYLNRKVKVLLVSLDFERQLENRVKPFIIKNSLTPQVILLSDPDANKWIDKVDSSWSGAIPATVFYRNDKRLFFEQEFTYEELEEIVKSFTEINQN
jgi:thiol-disulfide isomerase/thioredoxin